MDKNQFLETIQLIREHSTQRKFSQSVDLIINLRGLNLKKPEEVINTFIPLPYPRAKPIKIAALVGNELVTQAKEACDLVIQKDEFHQYGTDQKKTKKMAKPIDYFIAQANLMPDVAKAFGKVLGPMGKMPNPKADAVVPPVTSDLKPLVQKLRNTVRLQTKNELVVKCSIGTEKMDDVHLAENAYAVFDHLFHVVHEDKSKIISVLLKLTMGKPFIVAKKYAPEELQKTILPKKKKKQVVGTNEPQVVSEEKKKRRKNS